MYFFARSKWRHAWTGAGKTQHFQLNHIPKRSTLSDANKRRDADVFGYIYNQLLLQYGHYISDSRIKQFIGKQLKIIDSTTISLFKDILKCVGRHPDNGKKKGGIKVHTVINVDETVPRIKNNAVYDTVMEHPVE